MVKSRRKARAIALQVLYELDCTRHKLEETLAHHNEDLTLDAGVQDFARNLVLGVWPARSRLDRAPAQVRCCNVPSGLRHFAPSCRRKSSSEANRSPRDPPLHPAFP